MLTLQNSGKSDLSTVNVLPCRIHHNGPAKVTKRHWSTFTDSDGTQIAYFRGRKLMGKTLSLPQGYKGIVAKSTDRNLPKHFVPVSNEDSDIEEEQETEPVKILESVSEFQNVTVWGHDQLPAADDPFVKGVEEWIKFAQAVHGSPETEKR